MLIKQTGSQDNKQTINLAVNRVPSILQAHYYHSSVISPVLNCLMSCLFIICESVTGTEEQLSRCSGTWVAISKSIAPFNLRKHEQKSQPWLCARIWTPWRERCEKGKIFTAEKHQETVKVITGMCFSDLTFKTCKNPRAPLSPQTKKYIHC